MDKKYPNDIRHRASELFESGHGYKATATILGLPTATVRDWKRRWAKGEFTHCRQTLAEVLRDVMLENNERFIWSRKTSLEALQKPPLPSRMEQKCSVRLFLTTPECAVFLPIQ